jgi:antitoxin ParD1/3/4
MAMTVSFTLGDHFETFIQEQLDSGRYEDASDVVRDALRLLEERERKLAELDAMLAVGLADIEAGRVHDADEVFDELDAEIARIAEKRKTA